MRLVRFPPALGCTGGVDNRTDPVEQVCRDCTTEVGGAILHSGNGFPWGRSRSGHTSDPVTAFHQLADDRVAQKSGAPSHQNRWRTAYNRN